MNCRMVSRRSGLRLAMMLAASLALASQAMAQGVTVALRPSSSTVAPGSDFYVYVEVTQAGSAFNGFDAVIGYDPAALTLIPASPISLQEGAYMKAACGSTFHRFRQGADRDTVSDVLLCNDVALSGPGQIYKLQFRASNTAQVTKVRFLPGLQFYNNGIYVDPAHSSDATIGIGTSVGVGDAPATALSVRLQASPNPARSRMTLTMEVPSAGVQELRVCDMMGRTVRHLDSGYFERGLRSVVWDGRSDTGALLPPGVYMARLRAANRFVEARLTLLN